MGGPKVVITGTGRAGTTLLVRILDDLGLDTGLAEGKLSPYGGTVRAGLECHVDAPDAPRVVKDMTLGFRMRAVLEDPEVEIEHVILPTRSVDIAAASRIRASGYGKRPFRRGALTGTLRPTDQREVLLAMQKEIADGLAEFGVPYTVLDFPRFAQDAGYLFDELGFLVPGATLDDFQGALDRQVLPEMIHEAPLSPREVWRTWLTSAWMRAIRIPVSRVRRRIDPAGSEARLKASAAALRRVDAQKAAEEDEARRRAARDRGAAAG